ncbi:hypothetical protein BDW02DRAFT_598991 [Decorospora gaudefroyi]|uniref:Uncharacterized protein n=1 Tax=Decorospora gaudefroyi TaxID=184978 RepID=A0A6A5KG93_9PLEO|nr:hypothetical protein BDW02DRAFT_598991 [Decorospora gaudefroyi]
MSTSSKFPSSSSSSPICAIILTSSSTPKRPHSKLVRVRPSLLPSTRPIPLTYSTSYTTQNLWTWIRVKNGLAFTFVSTEASAPDVEVQMWTQSATETKLQLLIWRTEVARLMRRIEALVERFMLEEGLGTTGLVAFDCGKRADEVVCAKLWVDGQKKSWTRYFWWEVVEVWVQGEVGLHVPVLEIPGEIRKALR